MIPTKVDIYVLINYIFGDKYGINNDIYSPVVGEQRIDSFIIRISVMVFNATFNNISAISWQSVLLAEETGDPCKNHRPATDKLNHIKLYRVYLAWAGFKLASFVVIFTDCLCSCKLNNHTITATTAPHN